MAVWHPVNLMLGNIMQDFEKRGMEEKGVAHVIAAFRYSMAGARVLLREEAARLECVFLLVVIGVFALSGASFAQYAILLALFMALLAVEALNTAVELIVDRTSPERSEYGKQAKDIGSFAVFCMLTVFGGYALWVVLELFGLFSA